MADIPPIKQGADEAIRTSFFRLGLYGIYLCVLMGKWPQHLRDETGLGTNKLRCQ
jgi:hypothetical protein